MLVIVKGLVVIGVTSYMIRRRYHPPKKEVERAYFGHANDRKPWDIEFKDYIDERDEDEVVFVEEQ